MAHPSPRTKLAEVIRRAAQIDLTELAETENLFDNGKRLSTDEGYQGFGPIERIVDWEPDMPFDAVDMDLTVQTSPRRMQVIHRLQKNTRKWLIAAGAGRTMSFGTEGDIKIVTAAVLAVSFAQAAWQIEDDVMHAVFDENTAGPVLEQASAEEIALSILSHRASKIARGDQAGTKRSGLASILAQLPEEPAIVVLVDDFMNMGEADERHMAQASQHKLICCVVEDAREKRFPNCSGLVTLSDIRTGRQEVMTFAQADKLVSEDRARRIEALTGCFRRARAQYAFFEGGDSPIVMRNKIMRMLQYGA